MVAKAKAESPWAEFKRKGRKKPGGRAYDVARGRALVQVARNHPDEYQDLLREERKKVEREQRAKDRAAKKAKGVGDETR